MVFFCEVFSPLRRDQGVIAITVATRIATKKFRGCSGETGKRDLVGFCTSVVTMSVRGVLDVKSNSTFSK